MGVNFNDSKDNVLSKEQVYMLQVNKVMTWEKYLFKLELLYQELEAFDKIYEHFDFIRHQYYKEK